jgi:hypothetical protein
MSRKKTPDWVGDFCESVSECLQFQDGLSLVEGRYFFPDENHWGTHNVVFAPALMEMVEGGPEDGTRVSGVIWDWDLTRLQETLDTVDGLSYSEGDGRPTFTLEGQINGDKIVVEILTRPFDDADVGGYIEDGGVSPS